MKNILIIITFILPLLCWSQEPEPPLPIPEPPYEEPIQNEIYDFPDVRTSFPGGDTEMMKFISTNIEYPAIDMENGIQGKVYVKFVVETDGTITNIKVLRGVSKTIDAETLRIIKKMPLWVPAQNRGVNVRSYYTVPFAFRLK